MKSPLRKLKKFALHKAEPEENSLQFVSAHIDGLNQAKKDVENMKTCYDGLLAAAAATVNGAYEFSQSLQDMGNSLLEKTVMHDDGEAGDALSRLGRMQLELPKLLDCYRSQIISTITNPSDSLLTELRKVEEMISQCDEKRDLFEHIVGQLREKGKAKHGKVDALTSDQLKAIREEYDETARLCIFRVQSLKKGQCRSLLTLAAHHHAAQLNFFRKGLRSLDAVDTHIRSVAERLHIDYQLSESNYREECRDTGYIVEASGDGELSFDHSMNVETEAEASRFRNEGRLSIGKSQGDTQQQKAGSYSAPLYSEKFDPAERLRELRPSAQKFNTHVLPTPNDAKGSSTNSASQSCNILAGGGSSKNLWHSSPLDSDKQKKSVDESISSHYFPKPRISTEEKSSKHLLPLPLPLNEAASSMQVDSLSIYDGHKSKRPAFSDPLASKSLSRKPFVAVGGPQALPSLSMSNNAPPIASSPKMSELHELPRPPDFLFSKPVHSSGGRRHSAPIVDKDREISVSVLVSPPSRNTLLSSNEGSPLLLPKLTVSRSFSNSSSFNRTIFDSGKLFQSSQAMQMIEVTSSTPSVTHLPPPNMKPSNSTQDIRGGS